MQITLIDPLIGQAHGIKNISSYLKSHGHQVKIIILNTNLSKLIHKKNYIIRYGKDEINEILNHCAGSDIVGISVMTNAFDMAQQLTSEIKSKLNIPVILGGIHPTLRPEECLQFADMVCLGEGEVSVLELLNNMEKGIDFTSTKGIWFKKNGRLIKNSYRELVSNIDMFPIEELNVENFSVLENRKIITPNQFMFYPKGQYSILTARGCVFRCTYCAHNYLTKIYERKNYLRKRSIPHLIKELKAVTSLYDNIKRIWFDDDSFLIRTTEEIKLFAELYKKEIDMPFTCLAIPKNIQKNKIEFLVSAGMDNIQFGIESTTPRILKLYKRPCSKEDVLESTLTVKEVNNGKVFIHYDLILDNPWETDRERMDCLNFLKSLPRPYIISYFSLVFYPGVELSEMAKKDGFITDELSEVYRKSYQVPRATYVNLLFYMLKYYAVNKVPSFAMEILSCKGVVAVLNNRLITIIFEVISKIRTRRRYGRSSSQQKKLS
jgi:anaerobic magnesium-protoporphyrin IX monomethyl ester cyclase